MSAGPGETPQSRAERKERTRRAILDAALDLTAQHPLATLSLRQVAKRVGIVPTAFYRHFASVDAVGLSLVDEAFASLRALLREVRQGILDDPAAVADVSIDTLVTHVRRHRAHFGFIARERVAGPRTVRTAIGHEIELCERELATDLARVPGTEAWSSEDLRVLSGLFVTLMVSTAEALLQADGRPEVEQQVVATARTQLRMLLVGALHWRSTS